MTWITDDTGTRWVDMPPRVRRKPARALRFSEIRAGDQLMRRYKHYDGTMQTWYYFVTDLWFDPVAGQSDETAGRMVAIMMLDARTGDPWLRKEPHTVRGLASQGFHYADIDFPAHVKATNAAREEGKVAPISFAKVIRARPKLARSTF